MIQGRPTTVKHTAIVFFQFADFQEIHASFISPKRKVQTHDRDPVLKEVTVSQSLWGRCRGLREKPHVPTTQG